MDRLVVVQPVDRFGRRIVVTVPAASDRGLNAVRGKSFGVANAEVLRSTIRVMNERVTIRFQDIEGQIQSIEDEGDIQPALSGRGTGEVLHPQLIRSVGLEVPIDAIRRIRCMGIWHRRANHFALFDAMKAHGAQQALNRAACRADLLMVQLLPDLVGVVDLHA